MDHFDCDIHPPILDMNSHCPISLSPWQPFDSTGCHPEIAIFSSPVCKWNSYRNFIPPNIEPIHNEQDWLVGRLATIRLDNFKVGEFALSHLDVGVANRPRSASCIDSPIADRIPCEHSDSIDKAVFSDPRYRSCCLVGQWISCSIRDRVNQR